MKFLIFAFLLTVASTFSTRVDLCFDHPFEGSSEIRDGLVKTSSVLYVDPLNRRAVVNSTTVIGGKVQSTFNIGFREREDTLVYSVDNQDGSCTVHMMGRNYLTFCLPEPDKTETDEGGAKVSTYEFQSGTLTSYLTVRQLGDDILPLSLKTRPDGVVLFWLLPLFAALLWMLEENDFKRVGIFAMTNGISDSGVFEIPTQCRGQNTVYDDDTEQSFLPFTL